MKKLLCLIPLALAGCATHPDDISPRDTDHRQFLYLTCDERAAKIEATDAELQDYIGGQMTQRTFDAVLLPGQSLLTGKNRQNTEAIARLRGEIAAMQKAQDENCIKD